MVTACVLFWLGAAMSAWPLGEPARMEARPNNGDFALFAASMHVDDADYPGVRRAAEDLRTDFARVCGCASIPLANVGSAIPRSGSDWIVVGTIGKSRAIDWLIAHHKIDVSEVHGKWEASLTQVVEHPFPGVKRALVIAGSDKRGTIYGIYGISEEIGVSPWYWWADVSVRHADALYMKPGRWVEGEPAVKYRGIFLNDEAPALSGWAKEKFGGLNHEFYEKVFELLLRLRANYLWPAMWDNAFNEDDPKNAELADMYGIVMGTSHHEPMLRAQQEWKRHGSGPWNYATNGEVLRVFWEKGIERNKNYESVITLGMRGDGDEPMSATENIALLEKIVADQRAILARHSTPVLDSDPKVWALYKEVQGYYEKGMRVPDDVTLLWSDDNWGNLRRLPTEEERGRKGGAGIYYHFDYVGDPRSYKWLNTNLIPRVWEQMHLALEYGADRIWIVNVGDLKPMEFPMEFFLSMARRPERWGRENLEEFGRLWTQREFGAEHAEEIAAIMQSYTQLNSRRKPELLAPETYSPVHYQEAERVDAEWKTLAERAESLFARIPENERDAYFELVLYPVKASAVVNEMYIAAGRNHEYAWQGRKSANDAALQVRALFAEDAALTAEYNHKVAGGKWNHMMDQTHIGYTFWNEPPLNTMPAIQEVHPLEVGHMAIAVAGSAVLTEPGAMPLKMPVFDAWNRQSEKVEIINRGNTPIRFQLSADKPWIRFSRMDGEVRTDERIDVSVDWSKVPEGKNEGTISIQRTDGSDSRVAHVRVEAVNPHDVLRAEEKGFVEARGFVSMEAEHCTARVAASGTSWEKIPGLGRTLSGMSVFPVTAKSVESMDAEAARMDYRVYLAESGEYALDTVIAPTLNFAPGRGLRFAVSMDEQKPAVVDVLEHNSTKDWEQAVSDNARITHTTLHVEQAGWHTLHVRMVDPGVVVEKLVLHKGALPESYLGPPESFFWGGGK